MATKTKGKFRLEGYDTFEGEPYPLKGSYKTEWEAEAAAQKRLKELERTQPTSSSGGQDGGIQDRVYLLRPDGTKRRILPRGKLLRGEESDSTKPEDTDCPIW